MNKLAGWGVECWWFTGSVGYMQVCSSLDLEPRHSSEARLLVRGDDDCQCKNNKDEKDAHLRPVRWILRC